MLCLSICENFKITIFIQQLLNIFKDERRSRIEKIVGVIYYRKRYSVIRAK